MKRISGFTLIELMVVITIIGILAVIVLPNLTSVTGRGQDTAVKEQMVQFRVTAAEYYADNFGFSSSTVASAVTGDCLTGTSGNSIFSGSVFSSTDFIRVANGIKNNAGASPKCFLAANTSSNSQSWALTAKMRRSGYWCVDSAGNSKAITTDLSISGAAEAVCP